MGADLVSIHSGEENKNVLYEVKRYVIIWLPKMLRRTIAYWDIKGLNLLILLPVTDPYFLKSI